MVDDEHFASRRGRDFVCAVRLFARRDDRPRVDVQRGTQAVARFVQQVAGALREGKLDEAISIAERNKKSHIAKVVATGLSEFQSASSQVPTPKWSKRPSAVWIAPSPSCMPK